MNVFLLLLFNNFPNVLDCNKSILKCVFFYKSAAAVKQENVFCLAETSKAFPGNYLYVIWLHKFILTITFNILMLPIHVFKMLLPSNFKQRSCLTTQLVFRMQFFFSLEGFSFLDPWKSPCIVQNFLIRPQQTEATLILHSTFLCSSNTHNPSFQGLIKCSLLENAT